MYKINFQKKAKNIDNCRIIHKGVLLKREKNEIFNKHKYYKTIYKRCNCKEVGGIYGIYKETF